MLGLVLQMQPECAWYSKYRMHLQYGPFRREGLHITSDRCFSSIEDNAGFFAGTEYP